MLPSAQFEKRSHPYDDGYWLRYDGLPYSLCQSDEMKQGWRDCDHELAKESA